jgi:hypothetical protein
LPRKKAALKFSGRDEPGHSCVDERHADVDVRKVLGQKGVDVVAEQHERPERLMI